MQCRLLLIGYMTSVENVNGLAGLLVLHRC